MPAEGNSRRELLPVSDQADIQLPKPKDELLFENKSVTLWRCLLNDPTAKLYARRGQGQNGVDVVGKRDGDANRVVGIQCKWKGPEKELSEKEVRDEVAKAKRFKPNLSEYFIVTTAPDSGEFHSLALTISQELQKEGIGFSVEIWGWNTLEAEITRYPEALNAFDPTYSPFGDRNIKGHDETQRMLAEKSRKDDEHFAVINERLDRLRPTAIHQTAIDPSSAQSAVEDHIQAEIDRYRDLIGQKKIQTALGLYQSLLERVRGTASGRALFRIVANIGACKLELGADGEAADLFLEAYQYAPEEPKAAANKALALLIKDDWPALRQFAEEQFSHPECPEMLAAYFIQGAVTDDTITDPMALVPERLRDTRDAQIAHAYFVQRRGRPQCWWDKLATLSSEYPDDDLIQRLAAEAALDEIVTNEIGERAHKPSADIKARITKNVEILQKAWDALRAQPDHVRRDTISLPSNLIVALRINGSAHQALTVAQQALDIYPDDPDLKMRAAAAAHDARKPEIVSELLPQLPRGPDSAMIGFEHLMHASKWGELISWVDERREDLPDTDRTLVECAAELAEIRSREDDSKNAEALASLVETYSDDVRASCLIVDFSRMMDEADIANQAFDNAQKAINPESSLASRITFAHQAFDRRAWAELVDALMGHIQTEFDSEELRLLASACINDLPIRKRAVKFFKALPRKIISLPYFERLHGLLLINQGTPAKAEPFLARAWQGDPNIDNLIALIHVYQLTDQDEKASDLINTVEPETLAGRPVDKMNLSQLLMRYGRSKDALDFAYETLCKNFDAQKVQLRFIGLFLGYPMQAALLEASEISDGVWFKLEDDQSTMIEGILAADENRPWAQKQSRKNAIVAKAIGLSIGDTFEFEGPDGEPRTWKVAEIQKPVLRAYHYITKNFNAQFPDATGFFMMSMKEDDVQPVLNQLKRQGERTRRVADLYIENGMPMAFLSGDDDAGTIRFAGYLRSCDIDVATCLGSHAERETAIQLIEEMSARGATIDALTAWNAAEMGILDVLRDVFGSVKIAPTSLFEIRSLLAQYDSDRSGERMSMSWRDGNYYRDVLTEKDVEDIRETISNTLAYIENNLTVQEFSAPDQMNEIARVSLQFSNPYVLDPAFLAGKRQLMISEDLRYRELAEKAAGTKGVWLQAILMYALRKDLIDLSRYADAIVKLAYRRHAHLALTEDVLFYVLGSGSDDDLRSFEVACRYLGGRNADMVSHIRVASNLLRMLWEPKLSERHTLYMKATGIILSALLLRREKDIWPFWAARLIYYGPAGFPEYLFSWLVGHFLSLDDLDNAQRAIRFRLSQLRLQRLQHKFAEPSR